MKNIKTLLIGGSIFIVACTLLVLAVVFGISKFRESKEPTIEVTSRTILDKITDQYFVVTKTVVVDQESTIKVDQGSEWSNFLWGQTIKAEGLIRVDVGVDLAKLKEEDIIVDKESKTVKIKIPKATILDASQFGDIEVESKSGVLKYLLNNNPNEDHNQALGQLIEDAKVSVQTDDKVFSEARNNSVNLIKLIIEELGYKLEVIDNK